MQPTAASTAPSSGAARPPRNGKTAPNKSASSTTQSTAKMPSRSALTRTLAKGKGKMPDTVSHTSSCNKCRHAMDASMVIADGQPLPSTSPDCVLFTSHALLIPPDRKCSCKKAKTSRPRSSSRCPPQTVLQPVRPIRKSRFPAVPTS